MSQAGTEPGPKRPKWDSDGGAQGDGPEGGFGAAAKDVDDGLRAEGETRARSRFNLSPGRSRPPEPTPEEGLRSIREQVEAGAGKLGPSSLVKIGSLREPSGGRRRFLKKTNSLGLDEKKKKKQQLVSAEWPWL